jgi:hypothetical protein
MIKKIIHYYYCIIFIPYLCTIKFFQKIITAIKDNCWHDLAIRKFDGWDQHYCPKCGKNFCISRLGKWKGIPIIGIRRNID